MQGPRNNQSQEKTFLSCVNLAFLKQFALLEDGIKLPEHGFQIGLSLAQTANGRRLPEVRHLWGSQSILARSDYNVDKIRYHNDNISGNI